MRFYRLIRYITFVPHAYEGEDLQISAGNSPETASLTLPQKLEECAYLEICWTKLLFLLVLQMPNNTRSPTASLLPLAAPIVLCCIRVKDPT
jgi:hypothetical protein